MNWKEVRAWDGMIMGWVEDTNEGQNFRNFQGQILGRYIKANDVTTNFLGIQLSRGNTGVGLITEYYSKHGDASSSDIR